MSKRQTRNRILEAARDLYATGGSESVTMRAVGRQIDLSAMAIYRHFENREALLHEIALSSHDVFLEYLQRSLTHRAGLDRLRATSDAYLDFALENRHLYRRVFGPLERDTKAEWQDSHTFQFLVDRVRECIEADEFEGIDAVALAIIFWAHVHGLVTLFIAGRLHETEEEFRTFYRLSAETMLAGFKKE